MGAPDSHLAHTSGAHVPMHRTTNTLEGVLEHACQFGVTIWHMGSALRIL